MLLNSLALPSLHDNIIYSNVTVWGSLPSTTAGCNVWMVGKAARSFFGMILTVQRDTTLHPAACASRADVFQTDWTWTLSSACWWLWRPLIFLLVFLTGLSSILHTNLKIIFRRSSYGKSFISNSPPFSNFDNRTPHLVSNWNFRMFMNTD
jgi:hypothetical protein